MAAALVQHNEGTGSGASSYSISLVSNATAGNCLVMGNSEFNPTTTGTVSGGGETWSQRVAPNFGSQDTFIDRALNISAGAKTITFTPTSGTPDWGGCLCEFSGVATSSADDGSNSASGATQTTADPGAATTTATDLIFAFCGYGGGTITENAGGEGYTLIAEHEDGSGAEPFSATYKVSVAAGSPKDTWTIPIGVWAAGVIALKESGGAAATSFVYSPRMYMFQPLIIR